MAAASGPGFPQQSRRGGDFHCNPYRGAAPTPNLGAELAQLQHLNIHHETAIY